MVMSNIAGRKQYAIGGAMVALAAIGLYGILPRFGDFSDSLKALGDANVVLIVAAAIVALVSTACSAAVYKLISVRRLRYGDTLLVQLSGLLINRVIPAGIGGLSLNYLYLRAHKHTVTEAGTIVALNNTIGFMGHTVLALTLFVLNPDSFSAVHWSSRWVAGVIALAVVAAGVLVLLWHSRRPQFKSLRLVARFYGRHPSKLLAGIIVSAMLTLAYVTSLWLCSQALDVNLGIFTLFVIFTFGVAAGTATPTPGGLGGIEAALVAGLITQHITAATALAVVLLFRLVTYWLGLLIGAVATIVVSRRQLLHI
jgi:undecaprenyl-diphosphatase